MVATPGQRPLGITDLRHPDYEGFEAEWVLYRDIFEGGRIFIDRHLERYTRREDEGEFAVRKKISYNPNFAGSALDDVRNSIYQRMIDITREGGPKSYQDCVAGLSDGVDLLDSSMNYFVGQRVLPELMAMKKVGVYVDMPDASGTTLLDVVASKIRPYLYIYRAEEICNWVFDHTSSDNEFSSILLKESYSVPHPEYKFPYKTEVRYRYMWMDEEGFCCCRFFDVNNAQIDMFGQSSSADYRLSINKIPFIIVELPYSLLRDIARYQVALLNMASSDINYVLRSNFPFYVEQQDWRTNSPYTRQPGSGEPKIEGEAQAAKTSEKSQEISVGTASGRAYGQGLDRPGFIHPSPEPLKISMLKQEQLKSEIRQILNLAVNNLAPQKQQSKESKLMDNRGLEAGIAFIGLELEKAERRIANLWAMYEKAQPATVSYPEKYELKSDDERRKESKELKETLPIIPSLTFQKTCAKLIARKLVGHQVSKTDLDKIEKEIDKATFVNVDPKTMQKDVELGILDRANAGKGRCYPEDAAQTANQEHADRLLRIAESQATGKTMTDTAARGVPDTSANPNAGAEEKAAARQQDLNPQPADVGRGPGQNNGQPA